MKIQIEVSECQKCPYCKIEGVMTPDSFDNVVKLTCTKVDKIISGYVEPRDKVKIPEWCPFNKI